MPESQCHLNSLPSIIIDDFGKSLSYQVCGEWFLSCSLNQSFNRVYFNGAETNYRIAHILVFQLMISY